MEWQLIVALVVMVPIILLPVGIVWYLNVGGILASRQVRARRVNRDRIVVTAEARRK